MEDMTAYDRGVMAGAKQRDKMQKIVRARGIEYARAAMLKRWGNREYTEGVLAGLGAIPLRSDIERERDRRENYDADIDVDGWD